MEKIAVKNVPVNENVYTLTLTNQQGTRVVLTNYGNTVCSFVVKGVDIVLGFADIADYFSDNYRKSYPYFGAVIGRVGNRIRDARFTIGEKEYQLAKNNGNCNLHGGPEGFDQQVWRINEAATENPNSVCLELLSPDGDQGFPGNLAVRQLYTLTEENELVIESFASTDTPTPVNITHHDYFNLNGEGRIDDHRVRIFGSRYLPQDENLLPDGAMLPVKNSAFDFTRERSINKSWNPDSGYDQSFLLDDTRGLHPAATAIGDKTGIRLDVLTTEPLVHFYTGGGIPELTIGGKKKFGPFSGFCFETQKEPDAINIPHFSNTLLQPGEKYREKTIYRVRTADEK